MRLRSLIPTAAVLVAAALALADDPTAPTPEQRAILENRNIGYRNVYELGPTMDIKNSKLDFEKTPGETPR